jgi:hypothetical protein
MAITAQQFCSISPPENLFARDGISKTTVWKKEEAATQQRNFAKARTFPYRHAGANRRMGAFVHR